MWTTRYNLKLKLNRPFWCIRLASAQHFASKLFQFSVLTLTPGDGDDGLGIPLIFDQKHVPDTSFLDNKRASLT